MSTSRELPLNASSSTQRMSSMHSSPLSRQRNHKRPTSSLLQSWHEQEWSPPLTRRAAESDGDSPSTQLLDTSPSRTLPQASSGSLTSHKSPSLNLPQAGLSRHRFSPLASSQHLLMIPPSFPPLLSVIRANMTKPSQTQVLVQCHFISIPTHTIRYSLHAPVIPVCSPNQRVASHFPSYTPFTNLLPICPPRPFHSTCPPGTPDTPSAPQFQLKLANNASEFIPFRYTWLFYRNVSTAPLRHLDPHHKHCQQRSSTSNSKIRHLCHHNRSNRLQSRSICSRWSIYTSSMKIHNQTRTTSPNHFISCSVSTKNHPPLPHQLKTQSKPVKSP